MPATAPASAPGASDLVHPRPVHLAMAPLAMALLWAAAACTPAGWETPTTVSPVSVPVELEDSYPDDSADGGGDPAGIEEIMADWDDEADTADEAITLIALDPVGVARDLERHAPGFLAAGLPPAALDQVLQSVGLFHSGRARSNFERWLAREGRYRDLILTELEAAGLPEELLYLSMLESGFSPTAVSRAGAVGLWQFMPATGRESGLRIDDWVDERRDPIAATRAAVGHLTYLYAQLDDWALAAAAYNAGLGRVRRTRGDSHAGYFDLTLSGRLPAETRNYVPLILAASHVARNRAHYGFGHVEPEPSLHYDTLHVEGRTRLTAVAKAGDVTVAELTALNTHLVRGAAPPGKSYPIRVPAGTASPEIAMQLAAIPVDERLLPEYREIYAVVRSGDSWWRIANNHGVTVRDLRARNPRVGDMLHPGMRLLVERKIVRDGDAGARPAPVATSTPARAAASSTPARAAASSTPARTATSPAATSNGGTRASATAAPGAEGYRVRSGDTMSGIAVARGIALADLARWNGMPAPRPLREGELLRVTPPAPKNHRVARGETLTSVARKYNVAIGDLVRWNGLGSARPLREGEVLVVEGSAAAVLH
jgi:membrane-bound lytic murein transglycosylase D